MFEMRSPQYPSPVLPADLVAHLAESGKAMTGGNPLGITLDSAILSPEPSLPGLTHLLAHLPGILFAARVGQTCTYTYFSQGCLPITGYTAAELLANQSFWQLCHPEDLAQVWVALTKQTPEFEYRIRNHKGDVRWLKQTLIPTDALPEYPGEQFIQGFIQDVTPLRQTVAALNHSETRWQALIQNSSDLISIISAQGEVLYESPSALRRLLGYDLSEKLGRSCFELIHPEDVTQVQQAFAEALACPEVPVTVEFRYRHKNGSWRYLEATGTNFLNHPEISGIVANIRDISTVKRAEQKYKSMFEYAQEGIFQTSVSGRFLSANSALAKIYGYDSPAELQAGITSIAEQLYVNPQVRQELQTLILTQGRVNQYETQVYRRDGSVIWISENARAVFDDDGQLLCFEGSVQDITERKHAEATIRYQAFHDLLTGLPNRLLFEDRLAQAFAQAQRSATATEAKFAVMYLDIDRFKTINDTYGHGIGDQLLKQVAQRLLQCLREMDTVCRRGGDEFTILVPQLTSARQGICVAKRILEALQSDFMIEAQAIQITCSLGIAFYPQDGEDPDTLLRHADDALYQAKHLGRNNYQCFGETPPQV
jgi:diguanylate cyclase (GGDEF)-like protein/PAS domain S-box-containing protein